MKKLLASTGGGLLLAWASPLFADVEKVIAVPWQGDTTKFHSTLSLPTPPAGAPVPDSITFEVLNTRCGSDLTWEFYLNGVLLGTLAADPSGGCTCGPPVRSLFVNDSGGLLSAAWDTGTGADNLLRARLGGGYFDVAVAWVRAQVQSGTSTQTVCIYDHDGGDCSEMDLCSASYTWDGVDTSYSIGGTNAEDHLLKGVIKTTNTDPVWYKWVLGDGSESIVVELSGATKYNVEHRHGYYGAVGTPFTAQLCVDDVDNTMANAVCDNYLVQIVPINLDAQVNIAIDEGLWYLYKNQLVNGNLNSLNGLPVTAWTGYSSFYPCATAAVVQSFEINNHKESGDPDEDPYAEAVKNGLNWLLNGRWAGTPVLRSIAIGNQAFGNPDSNGNGRGIEVQFAGDSPYQGGMVMDCIIATETPNADSGRDFDGNGFTETYQEIVQDMVDAYAWGQSDGAGAFTRGGWRYGWYNGGGDTDNSTNQWAAIGLLPAEQNFGAIVPQWVKDRNALSLQDTWNAGGRYWGYTDSTGLVNGTAGVTRPSGLVQMILSVPSYPIDAKWIGAESWYADNFDTAISPAERTYYGWLSFVKAMRLSNTQNLSSGRDWYRGNNPSTIDGLAERLVGEQQADGSWVHDGQRTHPGQYGEGMTAGWAIQMLRPALFASPPIACFSADPNPTFPDFPITFDPSCSDHSATDKDITNIVLFEWDWDNDGVYDESTTDPVSVQHAFACASVPCTFPVSLRVTDDDDPALTATFTLDIQIKDPPHPPTADAAGPYVVSLCASDSLTLDGSASFDVNAGNHQSGCAACPDDGITAWDWDVTAPLTGFDDYSGALAVLDAATVAGHFSLGLNSIGLRVTDNTALSYPGSGQPNLTDADFTTVELFPACSDCDFTADGCEEVTLTSTLSGYEVLRSSAGPNHGFASLGSAAGNVFVDTTVVLGTTYYYRLSDGDCMTAAVQVILPPVCNQPPVADVAGPYVAECAGASTSVQLDGSSSTDPDLPEDTLTYLWTATGGATFDDATSPTPMLTVATAPGCAISIDVTLRVTDEAGEYDEAMTTVQVDDTIAPVLTVNGDTEITLECHVSDYTELGASIDEACDTSIAVMVGGQEVDTHVPGTYVVTYDAVDACGNPAIQVSRTVHVLDTIVPAVTVSTSIGTLWAPDHELVTVGLSYSAEDLCGATPDLTTVIEVYSDEREVPDTGDGTGKFAPDAKDLPASLRLRNERRGPGDGRVYLIIVRTEDPSGNAGFGFATVVVPHDQSSAGEALVLQQAADAVVAAEAAAGVSTSEPISAIVAALPGGTWTRHGVAAPLGPKQ